MYRAPRGTEDLLPQEQPYWRYIEEHAAALCRRYGYGRIDTPIFEEAGLFDRTVGTDTDIVAKEVYTFPDRGGTMMTLRPEGTAPVCRAYLEHGMHTLPQPVKLCYLAPIFRYERPQAGRYRQHHQFGFEVIGEGSPALDAEVMEMAWVFFAEMGLRRLHLVLNSIGCRQCRPVYLARLKEYYRPRAQELCGDCRQRLERNPLRLLDCKKEGCLAVGLEAPRSVDSLCPDCAEHYTSLKSYLTNLSLPFKEDHHLVRGLDYYTRTVFEVQPEVEGAQSTLGGGGRYDDLIAQLGGQPTPAVGFATGIERIILNLKRQGCAPPTPEGLRVFAAITGGLSPGEGLALVSALRRQGLAATTAYNPSSLKAQLRRAQAWGASHALILGPEELAKGTLVLRDMARGEQEELPRERALAKLKEANA
ncbi:MAG: histidine--tRNA ligase [Chloroflexi bacterium]|nr:histidine--tRNA ligase [Chloroflexota bacterium]